MKMHSGGIGGHQQPSAEHIGTAGAGGVGGSAGDDEPVEPSASCAYQHVVNSPLSISGNAPIEDRREAIDVPLRSQVLIASKSSKNTHVLGQSQAIGLP
jgi:hypothetical protein